MTFISLPKNPEAYQWMVSGNYELAVPVTWDWTEYDMETNQGLADAMAQLMRGEGKDKDPEYLERMGTRGPIYKWYKQKPVPDVEPTSIEPDPNDDPQIELGNMIESDLFELFDNDPTV